MIWKKNKFHYATWFLYTMLVGIGLVVSLVQVCTNMGASPLVGLGISGVLFLIGVALLWFMDRRALDGPIVKELYVDKPCVWKIEFIAIAIFAVIGLILRIVMLKNASDGSIYYNYARVAAGVEPPNSVHGIEHFYIQLLNSLFYMVGNKIMAAYWMQIILQMAALILGYFAVKKLSGRFPAMVMIIVGMISPQFIKETYTLSPRMLFLLLYTAVLWLVGYILKSKVEHKKIRLVMGILIGILVYLDMLGLTLLVVVIAGTFFLQDSKSETYTVNYMQLMVGVAACLGGILMSMIVDSFATQTEISRLFWANLRLYKPGTTGLDAIYSMMDSSLSLSILLTVMSLGMFTFWCNHKTDDTTPWILQLLFSMVVLLLGMCPDAMESPVWMYFYMAVLAGVGLQNFEHFYRIEFAGKYAPSEKSWPLGEDAEPVKEATKPPMAGVDGRKGEPGKVVTVEVGGQKKEVKLLDNPLPLPKKRTHKAMDYDYEVSDDDDYDIK